MIALVQHPDSLPTPAGDEANLWLPPRRLRRYEWAKIATSLIVSIIFTGWLILQWSNLLMRLVAAGLLLATGWVMVVTLLADQHRLRHWQLAIAPDRLRILEPEGERQILLSDIAAAQWKEATAADFGLWLLDRQDRVLAHLGGDFLADQEEARAFLGWARSHARLPFEVHWPLS